MRILTALMICLISLNTYAEQYEFSQAVFKREHIKKMSVVAPVWEGYTNTDGTGLYWEIMNSIYTPTGVKVVTRNVPWNRAMKMVAKYRTFNAIIGEYSDTEEDLIFPIYPIDVEYMSVLSKKTSAEFEGYASLSGKVIGWIKDYEVIPEARRDFTLKEFRNIDQGIEMLKAGVIDYLIDEGEEVETAMEKYELPATSYNVGEVPDGTDVYVAFSNDNMSRELIKIYNERVKELVINGKMAAIYKKWDLGEMPNKLLDIKIK